MKLKNNVVSSCKNQRNDFMPIEENLVYVKQTDYSRTASSNIYIEWYTVHANNPYMLPLDFSDIKGLTL